MRKKNDPDINIASYTATDLARRTSEILRIIERRPAEITCRGKPLAIVISADLYAELRYFMEIKFLGARRSNEEKDRLVGL